MDQRRGRAAAALATLALMLGLSSTSFADVIAGLILNPTSEGVSSSQEVMGTLGEGDDPGVGVVISDEALAALDGGSATYSGTVNVVTTGENGGAGVLVRSYSDPVEATVSGSVTSRDESTSGAITEKARANAGIAALSYYAGDVKLTSTANVNVTGTSAKPRGTVVPAATGVLLHTIEGDKLWFTHCYDKNGVKVPIQVDNLAGATHFTISTQSLWQGDTWNGVPIEDLLVAFDGDFGDESAAWDLYLITKDGTLVGQSQVPVSSKDWYWFHGTNVDDPDPDPNNVTDKTITVILKSDSNENGESVTITQTEVGGSLLGGYDLNYNRFIVLDSEKMGYGTEVKEGDKIAFFLDEDDSTPEIVEKINSDNIKIDADISGSITAQSDGDSQEALGVYEYSLAGSISATLHDLSITCSALRPVGIYTAGTGVNTVTGTGGVKIDVTGVGEGGPTGILADSANMSGKNDCVIYITGSGNSINVETDGPTDSTDKQRFARGISSNILSINAIKDYVRFEGPITVTDKSATGNAAYGIYAQAMYKGKSITEVIGDITVSANNGAGAYAQRNAGNALFGIPEVSEYVRGNINFKNAGDSAIGIISQGSTVVLDGDINMSGTGTKMHGAYAANYLGTDGIVYVSGTIDAPFACRLPSASNGSSIYLWDYTQEFANPDVGVPNMDEQVGSVIKYDEALGDVTLSSDDKGFVAFERDDRIYYGAWEGNTVTVSNCDPSVMLEIQDARGNVLEIQDPAETHTFTVPTTFEDGKAEQLGIYLTVHEHDWTEVKYEWADDNSTVTASRVCKIDETHTETETANVVSKAVDPTCTEQGGKALTAEFKNEAFETQTKLLDPIDALGHIWGKPSYKWETKSNGQKTVTATRICARDSSHVETETVVAAAKVTKQPTATTKGVKVYTATFKNPAFETQTINETITVKATQTPVKRSATPATTTTKLASTGDLANQRLMALLAGMGFSLSIAGFRARRKYAHAR